MDRVVGRDRWPTPEDEPNLPYIRAIIKEVKTPLLRSPMAVLTANLKVQRVHAPFWMATPHYTTEDFAYNHVYIPKDTVVVLNCYTMHHNEERYPDSYVYAIQVFD